MANVNVAYNLDEATIEVDVLVENIDGTRHITAAPFAILPGNWKVTWHLKAGPGVVGQPIFIDGGITSLVVPSLLKMTGAIVTSDDRKSVQIPWSNTCQSASEGKYDITGSADDVSFSRADATTIFHHDPTIAVVSDPITG